MLYAVGMSSLSRRQEYAEQTRAALLNKARCLFASQGFQATTLDQIAGEARLTKGAIYHHFKNKTEIYAAIFEQQCAELARLVSESSAQVDDAWKRVLAQCEAFFDIGQLSELPLVPLQEAIGVLGWQRWREIEEKNTIALVRDSVEALFAAGLIEISSVELVTSVIHATLTDAAIVVGRSGNSRNTRMEAIKVVTQMVGGLLIKRPAPRQ